MKNFLSICCLLGCVLLGGCKKDVKIRGTVQGDVEKLALWKVSDGAHLFCDSIPLQENGEFWLTLPVVSEGFYTIGYDEVHQFPLYLKPGTRVNMNLSELSARLSGKNSPENETLYRWERLTEQVCTESVFYKRLPKNERSVFTVFFPMLEEVAGKMDDYLSSVNTGNEKFDSLMRAKARYDMDFYAIYYLNAPRSVRPQKEDYSSYYHTIVSGDKFCDETILSLPFGRQMLLEYVPFAVSSQISGRVTMEQILSFVASDCLKGEYLLNFGEKYYYSYDEYERLQEEYAHCFLLASQQERLKVLEEKLFYSKPGTPAPDFACDDRNGNRVALSDFKGKVIVVDVWATWCEPCRKQMPYMIQLEEELRGENIVFISMCIGAAAERETWLKLLDEGNLEGIQIFMPSWTGQFAKDYRVNGAPRYMIFDKEGNIITVNAPQPTTPELKKMIKAVIGK